MHGGGCIEVGTLASWFRMMLSRTTAGFGCRGATWAICIIVQGPFMGTQTIFPHTLHDVEKEISEKSNEILDLYHSMTYHSETKNLVDDPCLSITNLVHLSVGRY